MRYFTLALMTTTLLLAQQPGFGQPQAGPTGQQAGQQGPPGQQGGLPGQPGVQQGPQGQQGFPAGGRTPPQSNSPQNGGQRSSQQQPTQQQQPAQQQQPTQQRQQPAQQQPTQQRQQPAQQQPTQQQQQPTQQQQQPPTQQRPTQPGSTIPGTPQRAPAAGAALAAPGASMSAPSTGALPGALPGSSPGTTPGALPGAQNPLMAANARSGPVAPAATPGATEPGGTRATPPGLNGPSSNTSDPIMPSPTSASVAPPASARALVGNAALSLSSSGLVLLTVLLFVLTSRLESELWKFYMVIKDIPNIYDQSTYWGRLQYFSTQTNPINLFVSNHRLQLARHLVHNQHEAASLFELQKAKQLYDSAYHKDTDEKVFFPFRVSCFVPTNIFIILGMLRPNPSIVQIIFWQWLNQSINVAFNFANANKSIKMNEREIATSYFLACATSCSIAVGLNQALIRNSHRLRMSTQRLFGKIVPFSAVATAGVANVYLMRQKELRHGIQVQDEFGFDLGKSKIAGTTAVGQVALSRIAVCFPCVFLPAIIMNRIEKFAWYRGNSRLHIPMNLLVIAGSLSLALPAAIAIFPQTASLPVEKMFVHVLLIIGSLNFKEGLTEMAIALPKSSSIEVFDLLQVSLAF